MAAALLLTHSQDFFTIDRVQAALQAKGVQCIRLNSDSFPESVRINQRVDQQGWQCEWIGENQRFHSRDIGAVWLRKLWQPVLQTEVEEPYHSACIRESSTVVRALLRSLSHVPWLDSIPAVQRAEDKYLQLRCAQQVGLRIPHTLISNDAQEVQQFYASLHGDMVCKMQTVLSYGMQANEFFFYTTRVDPEALSQMDVLSICPMIFQEYIPKAYELRVTYVDGNCFSGKIEATDQTDWRQSDPRSVKWQAYELPSPIVQLLQKFMASIGLAFGAIDLIRHTDGSYVFLEVNPCGEWGMLEKDLDLPISDAIAEGLHQRLYSHSQQPTIQTT